MNPENPEQPPKRRRGQRGPDKGPRKPYRSRANRGEVLRLRHLLQVKLTRAVHRALQREAEARGCTMAELARIILHNCLLPAPYKVPVPEPKEAKP